MMLDFSIQTDSGQRRRIPAVFNGAENLRQGQYLGIESHTGVFGGKTDISLGDARGFFQAPFDVHCTVGAGHSGNRQAISSMGRFSSSAFIEFQGCAGQFISDRTRRISSSETGCGSDHGNPAILSISGNGNNACDLRQFALNGPDTVIAGNIGYTKILLFYGELLE